MPCEKWRDMVERYRSAVNSYNEAAKDLNAAQTSSFNETWQRTERARAKCTRDRADLLHHEHVHACVEGAEPQVSRQQSGMKTEALVLGDQGQSGG